MAIKQRVTIRELAEFIHSADFDRKYSFHLRWGEESHLNYDEIHFGFVRTKPFDRETALIGQWGGIGHIIVDLEFDRTELVQVLERCLDCFKDKRRDMRGDRTAIWLDLTSVTAPEDRPHDPTRQIHVIWDIADVQSIRDDLSDEQALHVLHEARRRHDANIGINWDILKIHADELYPESSCREGRDIHG